jgi:hypothetical protein
MAAFYAASKPRRTLPTERTVHFTWHDFTRLEEWPIIAGLTHAKQCYIMIQNALHGTILRDLEIGR